MKGEQPFIFSCRKTARKGAVRRGGARNERRHFKRAARGTSVGISSGRRAIRLPARLPSAAPRRLNAPRILRQEPACPAAQKRAPPFGSTAPRTFAPSSPPARPIMLLQKQVARPCPRPEAAHGDAGAAKGRREESAFPAGVSSFFSCRKKQENGRQSRKGNQPFYCLRTDEWETDVNA